MRAALISLIETVPGSTMLRGALPLAQGRLAMLHVDLAVDAGAGEILCLIGTVDETVREIEAYAARRGVAFHLVRSVADISVRLASEDELLVIAEGLYVAPADMHLLARETGTFVATFAPGDGARVLVERFERIDINHIWAGLACVRARDLVEARDLPEDWNVQSALLRLAVQRGYRRNVLAFAQAEAGRIAIVRDNREAEALALQELAGSAGALGARIVQTRAFSAIAKRAWSARWARPALRVSAIALPALAAGAAVSGWSLAALPLLIIGRMAGHAANRLYGRFVGDLTRPIEQVVRNLAFALAFLVLTVTSVAASDRLAGLFAALMLPALAVVLSRTDGPLPRFAQRLAGSPSLVAAAAMIALPLGSIMPLLMLWNLGLVALLLWQTRDRALASPAA
ncbi:hypothetical protein C7451_106202 [Blastomonas natatoria]|uniref:Uncharacterized protein n=1 Tax=Blastomonas natatoria TaxID=34015 RepID=A0A2V3V2Z0_9SPHN|nr:hypothetical protein [Blastomonas natatoria]PXW76037.1 hypothetical protein C7451_106202 [Blastomonas natatoria]